MFRNLIPLLADTYRVIAPDYPGFGQSSVPKRTDFDYTFGGLGAVMDRFLDQLGIDQFALYAMDFGAPVGFRLVLTHPERLSALVDEIMLDLLYDIRRNVQTFAAMRTFLREHRPPILVATGANDEIFPLPVVRKILNDLPDTEFHALNTGHFALEDHASDVAHLMRDFLSRRVPIPQV